MEKAARGSDGRRLFTAEFKREQLDRYASLTQGLHHASTGRGQAHS